MISTAAPPIIVILAGPVDFFSSIYLGLDWLFILLRATEILAPMTALFLMSSTLDAADSPPVSSLTLFSMNGVIKAPEIFYSSASLRAYSMPLRITAESAALSAGIGTANNIPVSKPSCS